VEAAKPEFKPSEVALHVPLPFVGTFDKTEVEIAAGMLVHALAMRGNEWRAIDWPEIAAVLKVDLEAKRQPWKSLVTNPFLRPDFHRLVKDGYASWQGAAGESPMALTEAAFERIKKWVRRPGDR
jgi:hypothetical protein